MTSSVFSANELVDLGNLDVADYGYLDELVPNNDTVVDEDEPDWLILH